MAVDLMRPDLLVVGTRGRSTMGRIFVGSVTESLLRTVETDILAVPPAR
jgi:nucleotide-binding universal stress UspA family protein